MPPRTREQMAQDETPQPKPDQIDWSDIGTFFESTWRLHKIKIISIFVLLFFLLPVARRSFVVVPAGHKAVVLEFGKVRAVYPDGLHLIKPFITSIRLMSIRVQASSLKAEAVSRDTQKVQTEAVINWVFLPDHLQDTFEKVGVADDMVASIMLPALNEALKAVTAKRPVADILDKREEIKAEIDEKFRKKLAAYHVTIIDLYLTNLRFEADYEKAIEDKQVAEVRVKTKQNEAEAARQQARGEADAMRIRAEGEAAAKRALSTTLTQANLQLEWINAWKSGGAQVPQFVSGGQGSSFIMDLKSLKGMAVRTTPAAATE